ncbi:unnamed protein product [Pseudo-nitzschia multistriata]|uniref:Uncharacterized protein n=1 Tax=Pseudo-nitzschia multistriata TaxID=183589 RepID=A0A448Z0L4_9STRA|nr:unnamed protein product [Pseudo-nitzschia multistriata]
MTMQRHTGSGSLSDYVGMAANTTQSSDRSTAGGLGALSAAATSASSSAAAADAAAARTALGLLTSSSSLGSIHSDHAPITSLSRNASLGNNSFRSSLLPSSQANPNGLWGRSATLSSMPLLSPSELTGTADGGGSEALQALMDEHRKRRLQGELKNAFMGPEQIAQQAKADLLQFQPKKRARTMLAESTSNATAAVAAAALESSQKKSALSSYLGSTLGTDNSTLSAAAELAQNSLLLRGTSAPGSTSAASRLALASSGITDLNSSLASLGGAGSNLSNLMHLEQIVRKQQLQEIHQSIQREKLEALQRLSSSTQDVLHDNALLELVLRQQQKNALSSIGGGNNTAALEAQIKALRNQQQQMHLQNANAGQKADNIDKQHRQLSKEESAVANFMRKNSANKNNSSGLASLSTAQIQQMIANRQIQQDEMPLPPSLIPAVSSMDSVAIMQMLLPKNRNAQNPNGANFPINSVGVGQNSAASALLPTSLASTASAPLANLLTPGPFNPNSMAANIGMFGGLGGNSANGLGMIPRSIAAAKIGAAAHMGANGVALHPSASDLIYEQRRLATAAEVSNTVRDSSVGKPPDAFVDRDPDGRARDLPTLLVVPMDHMQLSSHQTLLRYQIEVFRAGEEDTSTHTRGRNKPVQLGQIGIRCRHCKVLPVCRRKRGSVYFPRAVEGFYQAAQNMNSTHLQTGECPLMGDALRREFANLIATRGVSTGAGRAYWAKQARKLGLRNTENGIVFDKTRPEEEEGKKDSKDKKTDDSSDKGTEDKDSTTKKPESTD